MSDPRRLASVLAISCGMFLTAAAQAQTTWYVDHGNCPGPGSGSERDPFCKIQDGINASSTGDTVIVADGTYTGDGNRDLDFGGRDIHLRSESLDPKLCIIDCQGNQQDQHRGFYLHSGETSDAIVEGFTITNGFLDFDSPEPFTGGAILCFGAGLTVRNCRLLNNSAIWGGGLAAHGPGDEFVIVEGCVVSGNDGITGGGGIGGSRLLIRESVISNNSAGGGSGGGGIDVSTGLITDSIISGNSAEWQGGGIRVSSGATILRCTVSDNTVTMAAGSARGGGISAGSGGALIVNCDIRGNQAIGSNSFGGGISGRGMIANCIIRENFAELRGGGVSLSSFDRLTNSLIMGNTTSGVGGGVSAINEGSRIVNCSIIANTAGQAGGGVAALGWVGTSLTIDNSIVWNNSANNGPQLAVVTHETGAPATLNVNFNDPQGGQVDVFVDTNSTLNWGPGNIDADPLFVDPDGPDDDPDTWGDNDYRLQADSPCIDAGDNEAVPPDSADLDDDGDTDEPTPFDLDGYARIVDGDGDEEADVDMGAYEFQTHGPCPWDLSGDGEVGPLDLALVLGFWGPNRGHPSDLDGDGVVGPFDLALVLGNWGPCP